MPGYGFAKAKSKNIEHWQKTGLEYLTKRPNLKRLFLLIDPIKGLKESDRDMVNILNALFFVFHTGQQSSRLEVTAYVLIALL